MPETKRFTIGVRLTPTCQQLTNLDAIPTRKDSDYDEGIVPNELISVRLCVTARNSTEAFEIAFEAALQNSPNMPFEPEVTEMQARQQHRLKILEQLRRQDNYRSN